MPLSAFVVVYFLKMELAVRPKWHSSFKIQLDFCHWGYVFGTKVEMHDFRKIIQHFS